MTRKSHKKIAPQKLQNILLRAFVRQPKKRLNAKQLIKKLHLKNSRSSVQMALDTLENQGKIRHIKDGKYRLDHAQITPGSKPAQIYQGYVDMTRSGAAYIICDQLDQDVYVPARRLKYALHGDRVSVELGRKYGKRQEGTVRAILERSSDHFVGSFQWSRHYGFVIPNNEEIPFDIFIHPDQQGGAKEGDAVMVKILSWPDKHNQSPTGQVVRIYDKEDLHEIKMDSILSDQGFSMQFPAHVQREADTLTRTISDQEISTRRDMRDVTTFTIDPLTAKDFDDAISCQKLDDSTYEIGIHIADVTHYVKPGSSIDKEAFRRSTSVYLVDRTAPMLPEILSNELCSLRPHEESLTFSAIFKMDKNGKIKDRWFGKTIIHSDHRFTYEEAQVVLDQGSGPYAQELKTIAKIARRLRQKRMEHGGISFETPEYRFNLDEQHKPISIYLKPRHETNLIIEDLMLLANREVAIFIRSKSKPAIPFVYRIHDLPDIDKLHDYARFLKELGFTFDFQSPDQIRASFARLHEMAQNDQNLAFAERFAVRTMAKAIYSPDNIGHFGLGFDDYTHFTSPIRRYADVIVHRILELNLMGEFRAKKDELDSRCKHISNQERKAAEAERTSIKYKQIEFISTFIGEEFEGYISGIIESGIFVALKDSGVEGLVGFDKMNDVFEIPDDRLKATSRRTGTTYRMGDTVRVQVVEARLDQAEVDFAWVD